MAQPNANSPQFPGPVAAQTFQSTGVVQTGRPYVASGTYAAGSTRAIVQKLIVATNGTTEMDVFGATNPFGGTFYGAKVIAKDDIAGNITLQHTSAGAVVFTIAKGSAGAVTGSFFAPTAFAYGGTATIKSSAATANVLVELDFVASNPALPGAQ